MEMESIFWLGLLIILVLIEFATAGLTTIWFAGGCIAAFIVSMLNGSVIIQVIAFLLVSVALLMFTRPLAVKYVNKNRTKTNVDELIGKCGTVTHTIDNLKSQGQVTLNGLEWTARTEDDKARISEGKIVVVQKISGVKLIVKVKEN